MDEDTAAGTWQADQWDDDADEYDDDSSDDDDYCSDGPSDCVTEEHANVQAAWDAFRRFKRKKGGRGKSKGKP